MDNPQNQIDAGAPAYGSPAYGALPAPPEPQEPARLGPLQRFTGVLFSPGETFQDVNRKPTIVVPILIAIVIAIAGSLFFNWRVKPDWDRIFRAQVTQQAEKSNRQMTEEDITKAVDLSKMITKLVPILVVVFIPISYLLLAGIFALGLLLIQAKATFKKILSVVAWSSCATAVVGSIVTMASLVVRDQEGLNNLDPTKPGEIAPTNVAAFLPSDTGAVLRAMAANIDIFTIWFLILLGIGFAAVAGSRKIKTAQTGKVVFGLWFCWILVRAGWAAAFGR